MNARSNIFWAVVAVAFIVFLLSPIVLLVVFSFTSRTLTNFPIEGLSFRWWQEMVVTRQFWPAFGNSGARASAKPCWRNWSMTT